MNSKTRKRYRNMTTAEILWNMPNDELVKNARRGGRDAVFELGYRIDHGMI